MDMSIEEVITRCKHNAEYERTHGNLQGCLEFRQLAKWLGQLQKIQEIIDDYNLEAWEIEKKIREVIADGNDD